MPNERELCSKWLKKFQLEHPDAAVHRIADSPVSRKPFDAFILIEGIFVAIEFKMDGEALEAHQKFELDKIKRNGGVAKVIYFLGRGKTKEVTL